MCTLYGGDSAFCLLIVFGDNFLAEERVVSAIVARQTKTRKSHDAFHTLFLLLSFHTMAPHPPQTSPLLRTEIFLAVAMVILLVSLVFLIFLGSKRTHQETQDPENQGTNEASNPNERQA